MNPIMLDENGHIVIDDSMSDELKEKIAAYNKLADEPVEGDYETEISDEEADAYTDDSADIIELTDEPMGISSSVSPAIDEQELDNLNNMFS